MNRLYQLTTSQYFYVLSFHDKSSYDLYRRRVSIFKALYAPCWFNSSLIICIASTGCRKSPENRKKTTKNQKKTAFYSYIMEIETYSGTEQTGIKRSFMFFFVQKLYNKCIIRVSGLRNRGLAYRFIPVVSQPGPTVRPLLSAVSVLPTGGAEPS